MAIVCVITSRIRGYPYEIPLPADLLPPKKDVGRVSSVVIADSVRQIDYRERETEFVNTAPEAWSKESSIVFSRPSKSIDHARRQRNRV